MLFNSIEFAIFLPVVFILYWFVSNKNLRYQNFLIIIVSYLFYGWWDWRFLSLIILSSFVDYFVGIKLGQESDNKKRKYLLFVSIFTNLTILGFFKYYNFFIGNFVSAFSFLGINFDPFILHILLPIGISFYTFQTLSYSIDVYRRSIVPTNNIVAFFAFVSFFPQLVAGPIERAKNLLPQFYKERKFDYAKSVDGMRQILWGLFKKIVIADNCAKYANEIFNNYSDYSGSTLLLGAILFAFQIYGDFSGYSDIAIGTARLFGINLMQNFAFPYFSRDVAEYWRRWHISLSSWFRDYVYYPLGGSRVKILKKVRNVFIIFIVSGFWHGASWTFIAWGFLNAVYFMPLLLFKRNRKNLDTIAEGKIFPSLREFFDLTVTFCLILFAKILFRSRSIPDAINYSAGIFSKTLFSFPEVFPSITLVLLIVFIIIEWLQREKQHGLNLDGMKIPQYLRVVFYFTIVISILWLGGEQQEFIYFQF